MPFNYNPNDPISAQNERDRQEALRIGRELDGSAFLKLQGFLGSASPIVRKMAASAMRKLLEERPAEFGRSFGFFLESSLLDEEAPQVLEYKLKALGACGRYVHPVALDSIRDITRDVRRPAYVIKAAVEALAKIEKDIRAAGLQHSTICSACSSYIPDPEQRARSLEKYGKPYCRHCQDEKDFEDALFTKTVDEAKLRLTASGVWVQSKGEKRIADFLSARHIAFDYDQRLRIAANRLLRPDFYLPEFDVYIEYWGMNTPKYLANKEDKKFYYQKAKKKLVTIDYKDDAHLEELLAEKLSRYIKL